MCWVNAWPYSIQKLCSRYESHHIFMIPTRQRLQIWFFNNLIDARYFLSRRIEQLTGNTKIKFNRSIRKQQIVNKWPIRLIKNRFRWFEAHCKSEERLSLFMLQSVALLVIYRIQKNGTSSVFFTSEWVNGLSYAKDLLSLRHFLSLLSLEILFFSSVLLSLPSLLSPSLEILIQKQNGANISQEEQEEK